VYALDLGANLLKTFGGGEGRFNNAGPHPIKAERLLCRFSVYQSPSTEAHRIPEVGAL
jgi:hypothetical protein